MSQIPPPMDPLPYATPPIPVPPQRPTSVTVIAIIAIILGSLSVLGGLCALPQYLGVQLMPNPAMSAMSSDSLVLAFNIFGLAVAFVLGALLIIAGVASLSLKPTGRQLLIWYAIVQIVITAISFPLQMLLVYPRMVQAVEAKLGASSPVITGMKMGYFGGLIGSLIWLVWPALVLYFMARPRVKAAFESGL